MIDVNFKYSGMKLIKRLAGQFFPAPDIFHPKIIDFTNSTRIQTNFVITLCTVQFKNGTKA